jgi:VWFA-related protein
MTLKILALCGLCLADRRAAAQEPVFGARSRLVLIPAVVTDSNGHVVDGLEAADFQVFDNGQPRNVTVDNLCTGVAPIALMIAVQSSGISAAVLNKPGKAGGMIRPLITGEQGCAGLISFSERVRVLPECTNSPDAIENAIRRLLPGDDKRARMMDAVTAAVEQLSRKQNFRRVLMLVSETKDRGGETDLAAATMAAQAAGATIYAVTYPAFRTAFTSKEAPRTPGRRNPVAPIPNPNETVDGQNRALWNPRLISPQNSVDVRAALSEPARLHQTDSTRVLTSETGGTRLVCAELGTWNSVGLKVLAYRRTTHKAIRDRQRAGIGRRGGCKCNAEYRITTSWRSRGGFAPLVVRVRRLLYSA